MNLHYKRILVKISGEQLAGESGRGFDATIAARIAEEIKPLIELGVQVVVMVGGGNLVRGNDVAGGGIELSTAHFMGMVATMINGLAVTDVFNANGLPSRSATTIQADLVADFYTRRRALHHLSKGRVLVQIGGTGKPYVTTDTAAVTLALDLDCDVVCKITKVDGVYDKDPVKFPEAKKFETLSFAEAVGNPHIKVMDKAALGLAMENNKKIVVCDLKTPGHLRRLVVGEKIGTLIS